MPSPTHRSIHIHIDEIHEAALLVTNFPTVSTCTSAMFRDKSSCSLMVHTGTRACWVEASQPCMPEICGSSRKSGVVVKLTNLSGTFQFDDVDGQRDLASELRAAGLSVALGKVRLFPHDGGSPFIVE